LPDKPSIAVLPFTNISGDPEQEYFSGGITEDIITDLSKVSGLFVIDRNSTFTYKGQAVKVAEVGRELGVRHVLEGSVRKAGDRVRINVQLIDAPTGGHMWAGRYDRELNDIFLLQDEITREIVTALNVKLTHQELERVAIRHTNSVEAFDYLLRGLAYYLRYTPEANTQARQLWEHATELDPTYADAYAYIGYSHWIEMIFQWSAQPAAALEHAFTRAQQALALDATVPIPHMLLGSVCLYRQQYDEAIREGEQAIALGPNFAPAYLVLGEILALAGRGQEAIEVTEKVMRLNPHYPAVYLHDLGLAYLFARQYDKAATAFQATLTRDPNFWWAHVNLVSSYGLSGQEEAARAEVAAALKLKPNFSLEIMRHVPLRDKAHLEKILTALRKAGLK
jgi:adenylate cyclase